MVNGIQRCFLILAAALFLSYIPHTDGDDSALAPAELKDLLDTLEKNLASIKTLKSDFNQTKHLALFDDALTSKGAIYFSNPGKIRFEIQSPFRSVLVVADKKVAKYEMGKDGWKRLEVKNADGLALVMQQIGDWMKGNFRGQSRIFSISAVTRGGKTYVVLTSKPKRFAKYIQKIEIELTADKTRFRSITLLEPGGDSTVLAFTGDTKGDTFAAGTFDVSRRKPVDAKAPSK